jgi:hypothetical protein
VSSEQDFEELLARHRAAEVQEAQQRLLQAADQIAQFTAVAAKAGVALDAAAFDYTPRIGVVAASPGLATKLLHPMIPGKDGLFSFADLASRLPPPRFQEGYFRGSDYMLMAHPCYRRAMHPLNNWAPRFIDLYWRLDLPEVEKYIAIDEDRVRVDLEGPSYFEADTWYDAPFNDDIRQVQSGTVKLRPPSDIQPHHVDFFFARTHCLDIKWSESHDIKSFQALELKTADVWVDLSGRRYYPARYLHAEFDMQANCFRHFDGAVQFLSDSEYALRRDSDFNVNVKQSGHIKPRSRKLFKLNGPLQTADWVELCCQFMHGNPLTFEYFAGAYPRHVSEALVKIRERQPGA